VAAVGGRRVNIGVSAPKRRGPDQLLIRRRAAALIRGMLTDTAATSLTPAVAAWLNRLAADLTPISDQELDRLLAEALATPLTP
jgi:hypothetical protein